jgi:hypothetical protein
MHFGRVDVCCADTELAIVIDEISYRHDTDSVWVSFLGSVIDNRVGKGKKFLLSVRMCNFVVRHNEHRICSLLPGFVITLGHASEVFSERSLPCFRSGRIVHQLFVAGDGLARDWMHHQIGVMLEIEMRVRVWSFEQIRA